MNDDWRSSGWPLSAFASDAARMTLAMFVDKHGKAFLVTHGSTAHPTHGPTKTRSAETTIKNPGETTGEVRIMVFPVRKRPMNAGHNFVSIGRVDGNDIAFADETVSKFHAFIREEAGGFYLQDARSRNGTTVEGTPVAARGNGPPTKLTTGQTVRIGSVAATFLDATALVDFVKRLSSYGGH